MTCIINLFLIEMFVRINFHIFEQLCIIFVIVYHALVLEM
jgi:hypothetical protein